MRELLSELYQVCGALGAPAKVLDQLSAAASGKPLPHETLLPFVVDTPKDTLRTILQNWREETAEYKQLAAAHEQRGQWCMRERYLDMERILLERIEEIEECVLGAGE